MQRVTGLWSLESLHMFRLNSGNFEILHRDEFYSNLKSWVKSVLKIIPNCTDIAYELQNFPIEIRLLSFCVGITVGGSSPEFSLCIILKLVTVCNFRIILCCICFRGRTFLDRYPNNWRRIWINVWSSWRSFSPIHNSLTRFCSESYFCNNWRIIWNLGLVLAWNWRETHVANNRRSKNVLQRRKRNDHKKWTLLKGWN